MSGSNSIVQTTPGGQTTAWRFSNDTWWKLIGVIAAAIGASWVVGGKVVDYESRLKATEEWRATQQNEIVSLRADINGLRDIGIKNEVHLEIISKDINTLITSFSKSAQNGTKP